MRAQKAHRRGQPDGAGDVRRTRAELERALREVQRLDPDVVRHVAPALIGWHGVEQLASTP